MIDVMTTKHKNRKHLTRPGFLLHVLVPEVGSDWAVVLSALAYGFVHGYQNPRQLIGSGCLLSCSRLASQLATAVVADGDSYGPVATRRA
jgi:hypothetical protein